MSTPNKDTDINERLELYQIKIVPQKQQQQQQALKIVNQLHQMAFHDTGYLNKATKIERDLIIALAMYYRLGRYDPLEKFTETYRNKEVIKLCKMVTEKRLTKTNTFYKIYGHTHYETKNKITYQNKHT